MPMTAARMSSCLLSDAPQDDAQCCPRDRNRTGCSYDESCTWFQQCSAGWVSRNALLRAHAVSHAQCHAAYLPEAKRTSGSGASHRDLCTPRMLCSIRFNLFHGVAAGNQLVPQVSTQPPWGGGCQAALAAAPSSTAPVLLQSVLQACIDLATSSHRGCHAQDLLAQQMPQSMVSMGWEHPLRYTSPQSGPPRPAAPLQAPAISVRLWPSQGSGLRLRLRVQGSGLRVQV